MSRITEKTIPITWDEYDAGGKYGDVQFYKVEFTEQFGCFSKGEQASCLTVSLIDRLIFSYNEKGEILKRCKIKIVAVE